MPHNFVADFFDTKKLCSRLSSSEMRFCPQNGRFAFLSPLWGLGATYDDYLRLIGKSVVGVLLVLIELFSLGVTAEALRAKIDRKSAISLQRGHFDPPIIFARIVRPMNALQLCR